MITIREKISTSSASDINLFIPEQYRDGYEHDYRIVNLMRSLTKKIQVNNLTIMPDLQYAAGSLPVGTSLAMPIKEAVISPSFIGSDIHCGMSFWQFSISAKALKEDLSKILFDINQRITHNKEVDNKFLLQRAWYWAFKKQLIDYCTYQREKNTYKGFKWMSLPDNLANKAMSIGRIGQGNHFIEFQEMVEVYDEDTLKRNNIDIHNVFTLIHSGLGLIGKKIYFHFINSFKNAVSKRINGFLALPFNTILAQEYFKYTLLLGQYALANRLVLKNNIESILGENYKNFDSVFLGDIPHNTVTIEKEQLVIRKGVINTKPYKRKLFVIPGTLGGYSYLVAPGPNISRTNFSLPHGAGRIKSRTQLHESFDDDSFYEDIAGMATINEYKTLAGEASQGYKDIDKIVNYLKEKGIITPIARLQGIGVLKED